jgi:hypothetical protein
VIRQICDRYGDDLTFQFSRYRYRPRSLMDERQIFSVHADEISPEWLYRELERLEADQELALHSLVSIGGRDSHLRMIDFDGFSEQHLTSLAKVLTEAEIESMRYFFSGRSFHGYSTELIDSQGEWVDFMARLLLSNFPMRVKVVDSRWVGHRLLARYSALRWSANTARHLQYPEALDPQLLKDPHTMARLQKMRRESHRRERELDRKRQMQIE